MFFTLEIIALSFLVSSNNYQRAKFFNSSDIVFGAIYKTYNNITQYLWLKNANEELVQENIKLHNKLNSFLKLDPAVDSLSTNAKTDKYTYIPAHVINNSVYRRNNYLTLDVGHSDSIRPEMAVVSPEGIVGVTRFVSDNYSTVISVLSGKISISAKLKKNNYFGSLVWPGKDYSTAELREIPIHVNLAIGDTLVTSGYSAMFPEGIPVARIIEYKQNAGDSFYYIKVKLIVDYKNLTNVYIIDNKQVEEQKSLEQKTADD